MNGIALHPLFRNNVRPVLFAALRTAMRVFSKLLPRHIEDWALQRFLTPTRHTHRQAEMQLLERGEYFEVLSGGYRVAAWSFGAVDAPVVVCSHGWSGRGAQLRAFVAPLLEKGFRVVLFDHPAHGLSSGKTTSLVEFAAALAYVCLYLQDRGSRIQGVVAHSLGGAATAFALKRLFLKVERVVLIAPPASLIAFSQRFARFLGLSEGIRKGVQRRIETRFGVPWAALELPQSVAGITTPALIIHDEDDKDVRIADGKAIAASWTDASFVITHGLGHRAILHNAGVIGDSIAFLSGSMEFAKPRMQDEWASFPGSAPLF